MLHVFDRGIGATSQALADSDMPRTKHDHSDRVRASTHARLLAMGCAPWQQDPLLSRTNHGFGRYRVGVFVVYLSSRILHRNDISYGVYIYHLPTVNVLMQLGAYGSLRWVLVALLVSAGLAIASWRLIEVPTLRRKKHSRGYGKKAHGLVGVKLGPQ